MLVLGESCDGRAPADTLADFPTARAEMSEPGEREFQIVLTYFFKPAAGNLAGQALTGGSSPPQALDDARGNADAQFAVFVCITRDAHIVSPQVTIISASPG